MIEIYAMAMSLVVFTVACSPRDFHITMGFLLPGALGVGIAAVVRATHLSQDGACSMPNAGKDHLECRVGLLAIFVACSFRIGMV